jgi:hypothetical protein
MLELLALLEHCSNGPRRFRPHLRVQSFHKIIDHAWIIHSHATGGLGLTSHISQEILALARNKRGGRREQKSEEFF